MKIRCLALFLAACAASCSAGDRAGAHTAVEAQNAASTASPAGATRAVAHLSPASRSKVNGTVTFVQAEGGVQVHVHIEQLAPGVHGFHIHEKGDCSSSDAESAGGHFNPDGAAHGDRLASPRHVGDLGNIHADDSGIVDVSFLDPLISLSGKHSILGRSVIVHANPDDLKSQPSGNADGRVACGVVEMQN